MSYSMSIQENEIIMDILSPQSYENITIFPVMSKCNKRFDFLSLKLGLEMGLVKIEECTRSNVNEVIVKNNSISILVLVEGEEIIGAQQNRIVNNTTLIPPKTVMGVSVSCTEHGRWSFTEDFKHSDYMANANTRCAKAYCDFEDSDYQSAVWNSINHLEDSVSFKSNTDSMCEVYDSVKHVHDDYLDHFSVMDGQNGIIVCADGEIKGMELFYDNSLFEKFHDKIIRSYLIDNYKHGTDYYNYFNEKSELESKINLFLDNISNSQFLKKKSEGWGDCFKFRNSSGIGSTVTYDDENIHLQYFIMSNESINNVR